MPSKQKSKLVYYAAWDAKVHLFLGGERLEAWKKWLKFYKLPLELPPYDPCVDGCCIMADTGKACGIWIGSKSLTTETIGHLAHEATHAANHILFRSGVTVGRHEKDWVLNDEPMAYLVDAIVRDLVSFIRSGK